MCCGRYQGDARVCVLVWGKGDAIFTSTASSQCLVSVKRVCVSARVHVELCWDSMGYVEVAYV